MENMNKNITYEHIDFSEITKVRFCTLVENAIIYLIIGINP